MFIALRVGITDNLGVCLSNTSGDPPHSGLAWASDDGTIGGPEKCRFLKPD
jgi:hypothetical protein